MSDKPPVQLHDHIFGLKIKEVHWGGKIGILEMTTTDQDLYVPRVIDPAGTPNAIEPDFMGDDSEDDLVATPNDPSDTSTPKRFAYKSRYTMRRQTVSKPVSDFIVEPSKPYYLLDAFVDAPTIDAINEDLANRGISVDRWAGIDADAEADFQRLIADVTKGQGYPEKEVLIEQNYENNILSRHHGPYLEPLRKFPEPGRRVAEWWQQKLSDIRYGHRVLYTYLINFSKVKTGQIFNEVHFTIPGGLAPPPNEYKLKVYSGSGRFVMHGSGIATIEPMDKQKLLATYTGSASSAPAGVVVSFNSGGFF